MIRAPVDASINLAPTQALYNWINLQNILGTGLLSCSALRNTSMKSLISFFLISPLLLVFSGCQHLDQSVETVSAPTSGARPIVFAWPFLEPEMMTSRGGTTQGSQVLLSKEPHAAWIALQDPNLSDFERDRQAILSMAGNYRTSFQFTETAGFVANYKPPRPYFSWATEHVSVIEDTGKFISLQHTLVMYFANESGKVEGPMVMKHWRQDWTYQDTDLHTYRGNRSWGRQRYLEEEVAGSWSQAVFQVDDSPRYEVIGRWLHDKQFSAWSSQTSRRPLPRREYSVRDDYNILEGEHRITLVPTGWVHEQHNRKFLKKGELDTYVAQEIGVNRYERIIKPDLSAAEDTWSKTSAYWKAVRNTWQEILQNQDQFQLKSKFEDKKLWEYHFSHADEIEQSNDYDADKWSREARETIFNFLNTGDTIQTLQEY
tara:strand:- start:830 stop:2119 length:1290 start_codon:yes stop_codon:yes gene_type:complete